jgi:hypothetical protein
VNIPTASLRGKEAAMNSAATPVVLSLSVEKSNIKDLCFQQLLNILKSKVEPLSEGTTE